MHAFYERAAGLDAALARVEDLTAHTVIFDVDGPPTT
jgi:hypothetical protein